jgi:hypothetical protein
MYLSPGRQAAPCVGKLTGSRWIARTQTCDAPHVSYEGADQLRRNLPVHPEVRLAVADHSGTAKIAEVSTRADFDMAVKNGWVVRYL